MKPALLLLTLLLAFAHSASGAANEEADSTLLGYYNWCNRHRTDPAMPLRADTLFRLAGERGNARMQSVALCLRADYYYYTENLDSLKIQVAETQRFTREHDQLTHYYFVWTRLILYYTKFGKYTLAQYELSRYQAQARKDGYKPAIAEAYKQLGHIYRTQASYNLALENYRKGIEFVEENDLEEVDRSYLYLQLAETYSFLDQYDQAHQALDKGETCLKQPHHIWRIRLARADLYARQGDLVQAKRLLREIRETGGSYANAEQIEQIERIVYTHSGDYRRAMTLLNRQIQRYEIRQDSDKTQHYIYTPLLLSRGQLHFRMGEFRSAADDLSQYIELWRQKVESESRETLGEFATLLDVERLDRERAEAQQEAQAERLRRNNLLLIGLTAILLLAGAFIAVQIRTNRRLARAKRAAEESDRMKGIFIRNITHEINTPLNAIVGFAELVAATPPPPEEERSAYREIIHENSEFLQKLVDDVLYISDIESTQTPPALAEVDIDACCRDCIDRASASAGSVRLRYEPGEVPYCIRTSRQYITKVLTELLRNAVRHAPEGIVTLSYAAEAGGGVRFTVSDTGPGVPAAEAERIFDRFVKLDPFSQGMGLGLNVCRLIARSLGGEIRLDTDCTTGARFAFTVPAA